MRAVLNCVVICTLLASLVESQSAGPAPSKLRLYIQAPPDAQAIKEEISKKVADWNGVLVVKIPSQADLTLEVVQSGKLNLWTGAGDKGAAALKDAHTGEDLWNDSRGGSWSMRGWSNRAVGRKLGEKLVEFLKTYVCKGQTQK
jgi:hypothetical protein